MIKNYYKLISLKASEAGKFSNPQWINVLNCGHWDTSYQGSFTVTVEDLNEMVKNFNDDVRKGVPIDTNHDNGEANGWITKLEVRGEQLWALCEWTPLGEDKITKKIFKYLSPEFAPVYYDPETNQHLCNNVLIAAALTNFPLMKQLEAVTANESKAKLYLKNEETTMEKEVETKEEVAEASAEVVETETKEEEKPAETAEVVDENVEASEKKADDKEEVKEDMADDKESDAKKKKAKKDQKEDVKEDEDKKAEEEVETVKATEDSMEEEMNEIADAFQHSSANIFMDMWYGYRIVGTYEDHIIVVADPDCDSSDWGDLAHVKYYQVNFKEDEATEEYVFEEPFLVKPEFVPAPEEAEAAEAYNIMMAAKESEIKNKKAEEAKVEEVATEKKEDNMEKTEEVVASEFTEEQIRDMELKHITKVKCADGVVREIKDGKIVASNIEKVEEKPEAAKVAETVVAVEGENVTILASEYQAFLKAKEELVTKQATEVVSTLVFNEKDGFKMPALMKDPIVGFYLKLNEGMREEFKKILEQIPAAKLFTEIGDGGDDMSAESAYKSLGVKASEIQASNKGMNYGQALSQARRENPELTKLASTYKK